MDAAQMLTAQEIARQCEYLAGVAEQRAPENAPGRSSDTGSASELPTRGSSSPVTPSQGTRSQASQGSGRTRHLRLADPVTEPIQRITEPEPDSLGTNSADAAPEGLTNREWGILAFERQWWKREGAKERAIRELFDLSPSRYYQLLNALLDRPEAERADPMLIKRLRRLRNSRQRQRETAGRSFTTPSREGTSWHGSSRSRPSGDTEE